MLCSFRHKLLSRCVYWLLLSVLQVHLVLQILTACTVWLWPNRDSNHSRFAEDDVGEII
jgi:hypothetical protein